MSVCLLPVMSCRSLTIVRSLLPLPMSSLPFHPLLVSSSPLRRHHACGSYPPRLSPRLPCRGTGRGYEPAAGCSDVVALLASPMPLPRLGRFGPLPSLPVISCGLAASHVPTAGAFGAVRSLRLLPRWSVSIIFKMLPCQSFKTLRLFDMVLIFEHRGVSHPVASPFHPHSVSASPASRSPPRPSDTIDGAEARRLRVVILLARRSVGRGVRSRRGLSCVMCHALVPLLALRASDRPPPCRSPYRRFRMMLSRACSRYARLSISPRPSTRETGSGAGRVLARRCG